MFLFLAKDHEFRHRHEMMRVACELVLVVQARL